MFDRLRQKAYQRTGDEKERKEDVRAMLMQLMSEGKVIEGLLAIYWKKGKMHVIEGGLEDDFEAMVMLNRAEYLINRDGLIRP